MIHLLSLMRVLFVCYGNSCRSPMAEAIFNTRMSGKGHSAISAGLNPAEIIQPGTLEVLSEGGFATDGLSPRLVTDKLMDSSDMVIAMDDWVADQLEGRANEIWDIPDPYRNPIDSYRRTRDILIGKIDELITNLQ